MNKNNLDVFVIHKKPSFKKRFGQAVVLATGTALAAYTSAASSIDTTGITDEIDGAKTTVIALFGAGLIILGIIAGYRKLKQGANSA